MPFYYLFLWTSVLISVQLRFSIATNIAAISFGWCMFSSRGSLTERKDIDFEFSFPLSHCSVAECHCFLKVVLRAWITSLLLCLSKWFICIFQFQMALDRFLRARKQHVNQLIWCAVMIKKKLTKSFLASRWNLKNLWTLDDSFGSNVPQFASNF